MLQPFDEPIYVTRPLLPPLEEYAHALEPVWEAQWLTNSGAQHRRLESRLTADLGVPGLSLFNNGTIALIVAVQSLRLQGEVITTPFTFPATPHVLSWNGIKPVFCDVEPDTLTLDATQIEEHITARTSAILGVHVYGNPCDVTALNDIATRYGLRVIYDAAHAFGTEIDGASIGLHGDITMFSFHATKLFHTAEGGALAFKDPALKPRIDLLKNFGIKSAEEVVLPGINGKMNELQATLGLMLLDRLDEERQRRAEIVARYRERLAEIPGIAPLPPPAVSRDSYQYFPVRVSEAFGQNRDELHEALKRYNVFTRKYFYPLCSDYPCYRSLPSALPERLPVAHRVVTEVLVLPLYGALGTTGAERICDMITELHRSQG